MQNDPPPGAAQNGAAREDQGPERSWLAVSGQASGTLKLGAAVVIAPDQFFGVAACGNEDARGVTRHIDQLAFFGAAALALAHHHETPRQFPSAQLEPELADGEVFLQRPPVGQALRFALDEPGHARHYNVGQTALFQKAEQLVVEEARIGTDKADLLALRP